MTAGPDKQALRDAGAVYAKKEIAKTFEKSMIEDRSATFPKFDKQELTLGKLLGKGGFGSVHEVRAFDATAASHTSWAKSTRNIMTAAAIDDDDEVENGAMESRQFIAEHCLRNNSDCRYAVKFLSADIVDSPSMFIQGIMDMAVETRILSDISHPNIIRMRAVAKVSPFHEKYFIVLDRLYDTLEKRIKKWGAASDRFNGCLGKLLDGKGLKKHAIYEEKIVAAFDLAAALDYLHKRSIVYRDLKAENIGFDIRNDVKLFDFGLAKELDDDHKNKDGLYKLTGMTGSPRYMAPEVGKEEPYDSSCDVYSFAILLWEMLAMKTPFELYTIKKLGANVWAEPHKRPFMNDTWPEAIAEMIKRAWSPNISERPTFGQITKILREECIHARDGDDTGLEHNRRRSTFVFPRARSKAVRTHRALSGNKHIPAPLLSADDIDVLDLSTSKRSKAPENPPEQGVPVH